MSLSQSDKIDGLTMVAPPEKFSENPFIEIGKVKADWVGLVPYGFSRQNVPKVSFNHGSQWWGETPAGVRESIRLAKADNIKVMLKPQVYVPGGWIGYVDFDNEKDWKQWESSYRQFVMFWLEIAKEMDVEMFCIATEYVIVVQKREEFWRSLIAEIRESYSGKLTYSSNWDSFEKVPFWDALDYIGLSAYFPLSEDDTPKSTDLQKAWKPIKKKIKALANDCGKQVLFTEYGYLSVDGCAGKTWELEKNVKSRPINEKAQAMALDALYSCFWEEEFWAGGFMWKWFPNNRGHEGYFERDYTPQGKLSEKTIQKWFAEKD